MSVSNTLLCRCCRPKLPDSLLTTLYFTNDVSHVKIYDVSGAGTPAGQATANVFVLDQPSNFPAAASQFRVPFIKKHLAKHVPSSGWRVWAVKWSDIALAHIYLYVSVHKINAVATAYKVCDMGEVPLTAVVSTSPKRCHRFGTFGGWARAVR